MPRAATSLARRLYAAAHRGLVGAINRLGWVVAPVSDYYQPLRPVAELGHHAGRWFRPSTLSGLQFDLPAMEAELESLVTSHLAEYLELPSYEENRRRMYGPGFTRVDALVLYLMLRRHRPARYVEVGSGLSTYYAWLAAERNRADGRPMQMRVVDPFVGRGVRELAGVEVVAREAQDVPVAELADLAAGDVLFIDSTHIVRIDGEVPYLVLEVLPALRPGVLVHIHDVHLPYNVPADPAAYVLDRRWPMLFTEAMLVQAYLAYNSRMEILMSTPLLRHHREAALRRLVPGYQPLDPADFDTHHGSLWLRCGDAPPIRQRLS
ncbi:MAG: class I SAM-dependent methyltransferase [Acidobacteriota bacterium]